MKLERAGMLQFNLRLNVFLLVVGLSAVALAQPPGGPGGPGGFGPPGMGPGGPNSVKTELVAEFDKNEDGWLNAEERVEARKRAKEAAAQGRGGPRGRRGGRGGQQPVPQPGRKVSPEEVTKHPGASLYDPSVLRTLFIEFESDDWEQELQDFKPTDVEVPATMTVDGKTYKNVGMRFRGASSFFMVPSGLKRSFNISMDLVDEDQRLYGYKTLNLLNSSGDASYMSTVLYSHIANQYLPAPKANHVHVVINGESWGVYVNVQQFNKDFLREHFESTKGTRWKVGGSPRGDGGLRYLGDDIEQYQQRFDMKSNDGEKAWKALIELCKVLNETPLENLVEELDPILDIDQTLKFLALDVVLVNSDGYWTRASDYSLFRDRDGKFHVFPHDMNEAVRAGQSGRGGPGGPGGRERGDRRGDQRGRDDRRGRDQGRRGGFGGPPGGPGGGHGGVTLDPLVSIDNERMPLRSRLLAVPELRAKYLQYVREIAESSLDWKKLKPLVAQQSKLLNKEIAADTRKLDSLEAFQKAMSLESSGNSEEISSLRDFLDQRRKFLLEYEAPATR